MELDLRILGYTIQRADGGQCTGVYLSHAPGDSQVRNCPTNSLFVIYKEGSSEGDSRCWKHFREFLAQNSTAVADIVIQVMLKG
jgi:hypothetical protein